MSNPERKNGYRNVNTMDKDPEINHLMRLLIRGIQIETMDGLELMEHMRAHLIMNYMPPPKPDAIESAIWNNAGSVISMFEHETGPLYPDYQLKKFGTMEQSDG
jgi:hypothetical protein